ncbi:hypothetical protein BU26DRAFT_426000 [Trematosphaeria pertusa]|uniref:Ribonuclease P/MRP protein subunit POP5 n=1 Tax=Trematosphaeria pertusa TaxID=390896 RepID=A0A6A6IDG4_9PLEO|nr:uncharacterized protein BU26DRAFT_426000 [Trematosphaeria pertusa]KAF2248614.1 hypothetical protein BU26DRAFT_426000 [Trematosphaeria pertusa]
MVRVKNRYLVVNFLYPASSTASKSGDATPELLQFHAPTPDAFHTGILLRVVREGVAELFGDYGTSMAGAGLKVNYWSPATSTAIIRCPREHYEMIWAALTFITKLPKPVDIPVIVQVVRVSGTIRKAEEEVIRRAKQIICRVKTTDAGGKNPIVDSIAKSVEKRRDAENAVLAQIDEADESESESD